MEQSYPSTLSFLFLLVYCFFQFALAHLCHYLFLRFFKSYHCHSLRSKPNLLLTIHINLNGRPNNLQGRPFKQESLRSAVTGFSKYCVAAIFFIKAYDTILYRSTLNRVMAHAPTVLSTTAACVGSYRRMMTRDTRQEHTAREKDSTTHGQQQRW
jgi:hypothetical protein